MNGEVTINKEPWPEEFTEVSVEKVEKWGEEGNDDSFFTELRVLSGPQIGQLKKALWFRNTKAGGKSKACSSLFEALTGNIDSPSYELVNKQFKTKPWYPEGRDFPVFTRIEKTGEVDPFA